MAWDFSAPPSRGSKWWTITNAELARQGRTARSIRGRGRSADAGRYKATTSLQACHAPSEFNPEDEVSLRTFIERHGRPIQHHLERAETVVETMRIAWAYRAALAGQPGAWSKWVRLIRPAA